MQYLPVAQQQFDIRDTVFELNRLFADANIGSIEPNRQLNAARVQKFCRCTLNLQNVYDFFAAHDRFKRNSGIGSVTLCGD